MERIDAKHNNDSYIERNTSVNSGNPSSVTYGGSTDKMHIESKTESLQHFSAVSEKDVESVNTAFTNASAYVDGGYGWFVCLGAFCGLFISLGVLFSWYVSSSSKSKTL
ncbi:hypothetical protein MBANPS3_002085 [Mucor bainieri]